MTNKSKWLITINKKWILITVGKITLIPRLHLECSKWGQLSTILKLFYPIIPNVSNRNVIQINKNPRSYSLPINKSINSKIVNTVLSCGKNSRRNVKICTELEHNSIKRYRTRGQITMMISFNNCFKPNVKLLYILLNLWLIRIFIILEPTTNSSKLLEPISQPNHKVPITKHNIQINDAYDNNSQTNDTSNNACSSRSISAWYTSKGGARSCWGLWSQK